jgi:tetratricopeptide (TPR) repeat protein
MDLIPFSSRVANALVSYVAYLGQLLHPVNLAVFYPHPGMGVPIWNVFGAFLLMAGIFAAVLAWRRKCPYLLVGWLWYVGTLVPVIGLVQVGGQARADRYTYLTQIGLYIAIAWGASQLSRERPHRRWICGVTSALVVVLMAVCAWAQTSYWRDSETLWTHALACAPEDVTCHYYLGLVLAERGQLDEAIVHYRTALEIEPGFASAHNNLGLALAGSGQVDEAIAEYRKVLQINANDPQAHNNLALALAGRGETDEAIAHYEKSLEINPDSPMTHNNLGDALTGRGRLDAAIGHYQKALELKPDFVEARENLGRAMAARERLKKAEKDTR